MFDGITTIYHDLSKLFVAGVTTMIVQVLCCMNMIHIVNDLESNRLCEN